MSSTDWAMDEIAQSLLWAQAYRKQPWEGLERLAVRFDIPDLTDLARAMAQAGDGARIRDSLEAKAHSLRLKETSALEDAAQAVTQKMLLPGVLLMAGYGVLDLLSRPGRLHRQPTSDPYPSRAEPSDPANHRSERNHHGRIPTPLHRPEQRRRSGQRVAATRTARVGRGHRPSFLRAYVAARLTPIVGDERGEIASWVVVTALVSWPRHRHRGHHRDQADPTANNIQTP